MANYDVALTHMNAMLADSKVNLKSGLPTQMIPGMSHFVANAALYYEAHGLNMRIAVNHLSETLYQIGGAPTNFSTGSIPTDIYLAPRTEVDASASYDLTRQFTVFGEVTNINNSTYSTHGRFENQALDIWSYGRRFTLGARFRY